MCIDNTKMESEIDFFRPYNILLDHLHNLKNLINEKMWIADDYVEENIPWQIPFEIVCTYGMYRRGNFWDGMMEIRLNNRQVCSINVDVADKNFRLSHFWKFRTIIDSKAILTAKFPLRSYFAIRKNINSRSYTSLSN